MLFDFLEKMTYLIFKYLLSWWEISFKIWVLFAGFENQLGWTYESDWIELLASLDTPHANMLVAAS